ncbi:MAG: hypothetical protein E3J29_00180 [Dehalococcoidia bacterium]|nr:MAG: hypothetical protein E3J29_00180 [Dehalococcoidia bacterium]
MTTATTRTPRVYLSSLPSHFVVGLTLSQIFLKPLGHLKNGVNPCVHTALVEEDALFKGFLAAEVPELVSPLFSWPWWRLLAFWFIVPPWWRPLLWGLSRASVWASAVCPLAL